MCEVENIFITANTTQGFTMHKRLLLTFVGLVSTCLPLPGQQPVTPLPVDSSLIPTPPFSYNGMVIAHPQQGPLGVSGSIIGEGVFATIANIAYDEENLYWIPPSTVHYYPRLNSVEINLAYPDEDLYARYLPIAFYKWEEYGSRVQNHNGSTQSVMDILNLDFAVGYFSATAEDDFLLQHPELNIEEAGEVSVLRYQNEKMVVGYPRVDVGENEGLMHLTQPDNYAFFSVHDVYSNVNRNDSGGRIIAEYLMSDVVLGAGIGGAPVYVRDDMSNWMMSGIIHVPGGSGMLVRGIDDNAYYDVESGSAGMIKQAIIARNGHALMRVEDLQVAETTSGSVELSWTDDSNEETGYLVLRQETGKFEEIASLPPDASSYIDDTVQPGLTYHYRVQPYKDLMDPYHRNRAPKSRQVRASVPGIHRQAQSILGADFLHLRSDGDSSWYPENGQSLRAGAVHSTESSSLILDIIGPGILSFEWSASCEENPDYASQGSQNQGRVYDAIWLYMDDEQAMEAGIPIFLCGPLLDDPTGLKGPMIVQTNVPAGAHKLEWRYAKDAYGDNHQDTAFLDSLSWNPDPVNPYPVYGAWASAVPDWHVSEWFGMYNVQHTPWVYHEQLGWLYMMGGTGSRGMFIHSNNAALGTLYTSPHCWPFLYQPETGSWYYYFVDSGHVIPAGS